MNMNLYVSPDNTFIVYPKYRYGKNQSLLYDIWKINVDTKKKTLLTNSMRANYPKFSPDGRSILFVAHERSTTQLYTMDINGNNINQIIEVYKYLYLYVGFVLCYCCCCVLVCVVYVIVC